MNRPIGATPDGATILQPGRRYRLLLVVQGSTDTDALCSTLIHAAGFEPQRLGVSLPQDWPAERPPDWPEESLIGLMPGQSLIRVSGPCWTPGPVRLEHETPIPPGASFRVIDAWDYGQAEPPAPLQERTGAAPPQPSGRAKKMLFGAAAIAGVALGWHWLQGKRKEERDEERLLRLADRAEREDLSRAVQEMVSGGMSRAEAMRTVAQAGEPCGGSCSHGVLEDLEHQGRAVYVRIA